MSKKYLIYISSSLDDLKAERKELVKIVTELGAIPVTMDGFDISEAENQGYIKQAIKDADYFINITAYKCGPIAGNSFGPEIELAWAERARVPVLAFIIDEKARWKDSKKEKEKTAAKALEIFKKRLTEHTYSNWTTTADLRQKAMSLLVREMNLHPRQGWVRADDAVTPATANELSRLVRENDQLRSQIRVDGGSMVSRLKVQMKYCLKVLATNKISLSFWYVSGDNWENTKVYKYLRLFKLLVPELSTAKTTSEISRFLGNILNPDLDKTVRKDYPTPTNTIKKIMADLSMLKLVKSAKEGKNGTASASNEDEAWEITEYGREVFAAYRLRQMNRALLKIQKIADKPEIQ